MKLKRAKTGSSCSDLRSVETNDKLDTWQKSDFLLRFLQLSDNADLD